MAGAANTIPRVLVNRLEAREGHLRYPFRGVKCGCEGGRGENCDILEEKKKGYLGR